MFVTWFFCVLAIVFGVIVSYEVVQRSGLNVYRDTLRFRKDLSQHYRGLIDDSSISVLRNKFEARLLKSDSSLSRSFFYWSIPACMISIAVSFYGFNRERELAQLEQVPSASRIPIIDRAAQVNKQFAKGDNASVEPRKNIGGDLNQLASRLAMKLTKDEKNGDGWLLLARTYQELGKFDEALKAYEKAATLLPEDPQLYGDWIDLRVRWNSSKWDETGRDILQKASQKFPNNPRILILLGASSFDKKSYKEAINYWRSAQTYSLPESKEFELAKSSILEAERLSSK